jgi:hypothetical protein
MEALVAIHFAIVHDQYIEGAANGVLHRWIEVPLETAV